MGHFGYGLPNGGKTKLTRPNCVIAKCLKTLRMMELAENSTFEMRGEETYEYFKWVFSARRVNQSKPERKLEKCEPKGRKKLNKNV